MHFYAGMGYPLDHTRAILEPSRRSNRPWCSPLNKYCLGGNADGRRATWSSKDCTVRLKPPDTIHDRPI